VKPIAPLLIVLLLSTLVTAQSSVLTFSGHELGQPPAGFFNAGARLRSPGAWHMRGVALERHLVHERDHLDYVHGVALAGLPMNPAENQILGSRIRFVEGDMVAGVFWACQDSNKTG
jgi:hypothetical protein